MMEGTKKTWTLHPPKGKNSLSLAPSLSLSLSCLYYSSIVLVDGLVADQAGIYKRLTIVQMPGDVLYLPPAWHHSVSLSLSRLPLCLSMSLMYWQVTTHGGLTKVKKTNGMECDAAALTIVA